VSEARIIGRQDSIQNTFELRPKNTEIKIIQTATGGLH
jgi:hypothetical protein